MDMQDRELPELAAVLAVLDRLESAELRAKEYEARIDSLGEVAKSWRARAEAAERRAEDAEKERYQILVVAERISSKRDALDAQVEALEKERDALVSSMPRNPEQMIEFIGSNYNAVEFRDRNGNPLRGEDVNYSLTVHDLLSSFIEAGLYDFDAAMAQEGGK